MSKTEAATKTASKTATKELGLKLSPMLHVRDLSKHVDFFERLGGSLLYGSRDGDFALMRFGETELGLLGHPPNPEQGDHPLELNFSAELPLEQIESAVDRDSSVVQGVSDEAFGRQLLLKTPDGLLVKINQIERDLVE